MREFLEGSGVYLIPVSDLPDSTWFIRDDRGRGAELETGSENNKIPPLLHICERDIDPGIDVPTYVVITETVRWDSYLGHYSCQGCKQVWNDEKGLKAIWADGLGTGDEGYA